VIDLDRLAPEKPPAARPARSRRRMLVAAVLASALLVPAGATYRVLGDTAGCATADRYLVCRTVKDAVQVWRIGVPG